MLNDKLSGFKGNEGKKRYQRNKQLHQYLVERALFLWWATVMVMNLGMKIFTAYKEEQKNHRGEQQ